MTQRWEEQGREYLVLIRDGAAKMATALPAKVPLSREAGRKSNWSHVRSPEASPTLSTATEMGVL